MADPTPSSRLGGPFEPPRRPPIATDPADPGGPILVRLDGQPVGDLGHPRTDAALVVAILLREGRVGAWLAQQGVSRSEVEAAFGPTHWPG